MHTKSPKKYYVYRITNIKNKKHYYGYKGISQDIDPKLHIGIKYFSSSSDKEFILDQQKNQQNYCYKIIFVFNNKYDAIALEIKLHNKFNVDKNSNFYNKAKQTSTGFTTNGSRTGEHFVMVRDLKNNIKQIPYTQFDRLLYTGLTKGKSKAYVNGNLSLVDSCDIKNGKFCGMNTNMIVALNLETNNKELITKEQFKTSTKYVGHTKGFTTAIKISTNEKVYIPSKLLKETPTQYIHLNKNRVISHEIKNKLKQSAKNAKVLVYNAQGESLLLSRSDTLIKSGEYGKIQGKPCSVEFKKLNKRFTCRSIINFLNFNSIEINLDSVRHYLTKRGFFENEMIKICRL